MFWTPKKDVSMLIVTKSTLFTTAVRSFWSEAKNVQVLSIMIKRNKFNNNPNNPRLALKQAAQIQEKK